MRHCAICNQPEDCHPFRHRFEPSLLGALSDPTPEPTPSKMRRYAVRFRSERGTVAIWIEALYLDLALASAQAMLRRGEWIQGHARDENRRECLRSSSVTSIEVELDGE